MYLLAAGSSRSVNFTGFSSLREAEKIEQLPKYRLKARWGLQLRPSVVALDQRIRFLAPVTQKLAAH